jgi:hypothetical protein
VSSGKRVEACGVKHLTAFNYGVPVAPRGE